MSLVLRVPVISQSADGFTQVWMTRRSKAKSPSWPSRRKCHDIRRCPTEGLYKYKGSLCTRGPLTNHPSSYHPATRYSFAASVSLRATSPNRYCAQLMLPSAIVKRRVPISLPAAPAAIWIGRRWSNVGWAWRASPRLRSSAIFALLLLGSVVAASFRAPSKLLTYLWPCQNLHPRSSTRHAYGIG